MNETDFGNYKAPVSKAQEVNCSIVTLASLMMVGNYIISSFAACSLDTESVTPFFIVSRHFVKNPSSIIPNRLLLAHVGYHTMEVRWLKCRTACTAMSCILFGSVILEISNSPTWLSVVSSALLEYRMPDLVCSHFQSSPHGSFLLLTLFLSVEYCRSHLIMRGYILIVAVICFVFCLNLGACSPEI